MESSLIINLLSALPLDDTDIEMNEQFLGKITEEYATIGDPALHVYNVLVSLENSKPKLTILFLEDKEFINSGITPLNEDIGDPKTLSDIFKQIGVHAKDEMKNKILVNWGHGLAYSMYLPIGSKDKGIDTATVLVSTDKKTRCSRGDETGFDPISYDAPMLMEPSFSIKRTKEASDNFIGVTALTINELKKAIEVADLKFDLMIFDCCFMQTIDTFYTLHERTTYIIGSQSTLAWLGFDYSYFKNLGSKVDDKFCDDFCKNSIKTMKSLFAEPQFKFILDNYVVSCIKTTEAKTFFLHLENLVDFWSKNFKSPNNENDIPLSLVFSKNNNKDLTKSGFTEDKHRLHLVDLKNMFMLFEKNTKFTYPNFAPGYQELLGMLDPKAKRIIVSLQPNDTDKEIAGGISICFPRGLDVLSKNVYYLFFLRPEAKILSPFSASSGWGNFLFNFLKYLG